MYMKLHEKPESMLNTGMLVPAKYFILATLE